MNISGIVSQYGFLFQRKVFVLYVLENMNVKQRFCFEGKDDVEVAMDDRICELDKSSSNCVQVKSGIVDKTCFNKVLGNWLLLDSFDKDTYTLFVENKLGFEWSREDIIKEFNAFVEKGKSNKKTSIAKKVYEKYKDDIENNESKQLITDAYIILDKINLDLCSIKELDIRLEKIFFDNHCQDIIEYEMAKKKRLEKLIYYIDKQIDESIKEKEAYSLIFAELMRLIILVCDEISDHSYKVDVASLKTAFIEKANKIVEEKRDREVRQLFLVNTKEAFVVNGIVQELFYKDFREIFAEKRGIDISNLEEFAKANYDNAKYEIEEDSTPKELYNVTISKPIDSNFLPAGPMYKNGCYIYLTGDKIAQEKQITWGDESENK